MNKSKSQFEGSNIGQPTHLSHYLHSQLQSFETGGKTQQTKRQRNPQTQHFKGKRMPEVELGTQLAESLKDSVKFLEFQNCPSFLDAT